MSHQMQNEYTWWFLNLLINNKAYKLLMIKLLLLLIQKTYQFINVVNGVSHSHKTANIYFSFDSVA